VICQTVRMFVVYHLVLSFEKFSFLFGIELLLIYGVSRKARPKKSKPPLMYEYFFLGVKARGQEAEYKSYERINRHLERLTFIAI